MYMITCILQKPQFYSYLDTFVFSFINLFVVAGIEELFYRGILFTEFKNEKGIYFAYTASTILFIVAHVNAFMQAGSSMAFLYLITIIIMTLWFTFIFNKTNSIFIAILFHGLANLNNILVYFLILISIMILLVKSYFTRIQM